MLSHVRYHSLNIAFVMNWREKVIKTILEAANLMDLYTVYLWPGPVVRGLLLIKHWKISRPHFLPADCRQPEIRR